MLGTETGDIPAAKFLEELMCSIYRMTVSQGLLCILREEHKRPENTLQHPFQIIQNYFTYFIHFSIIHSLHPSDFQQ